MANFGTDGFRGKASEFDSEGLKRIGYELARRGFAGRIVIGYDTRESSTQFRKDLIRGINFADTEVVDLGVVTTPIVCYFSKVLADAKYGIMITASHNSHEDNGIKVFEFGNKINSDLEEILIQCYNGSNFTFDNREENIKYRDSNNYFKHVNFNLEIRDKINKDLNIVIDTANGSASSIAKNIFVGNGFTYINDSPNGVNINENCGSEHPKCLQDKILQSNGYLGIAFDGDCDRVLFCDEKGQVIDGDHLIGFIANDMIKKGQLNNNTVVVSEYSNLALDDYIRSIGGNVIRVNNGDKNIFAKMKELNLSFGAEKLGHIIFGTYFGSGDGLYSAKEVLSRLDYSKTISEQIRPFELNSQIILNVPVIKKIPFEDILGFNETYSDVKKRLNGSGRLHVRYSGTENYCRIMIESSDNLPIKLMGEELASRF